MQKQEGRVSQAALYLPNYPGMRISKSFIQQHLSSWQAHLKRISTFLQMGKGVWWIADHDCYVFRDSSEDQEYHAEGPPLLHFRNTQLQDVPAQAKARWETIIANKTELPTPQVRLYDDNGMPTGIINFESVRSVTNPLCSQTTTLPPSAELGSQATTPLGSQATTTLHPSSTTPLGSQATTPLHPSATTPLGSQGTTPLHPSASTPLGSSESTTLCHHFTASPFW